MKRFIVPSGYDPENEEETYRPSHAALLHQFVPVEDAPSTDPDPAQALMLKEESRQEDDGEVALSFDPNDIGRPSTYVFGDEHKTNGEVHIAFEEVGGCNGISLEPDLIQEVLCINDGLRNKSDSSANCCESHGARGRRPRYKDKFVVVVVF